MEGRIARARFPGALLLIFLHADACTGTFFLTEHGVLPVHRAQPRLRPCADL